MGSKRRALIAGATTAQDVPTTGPEAPPAWLFGRADQVIDILIVLAADSAEDLLSITQEVRQIAALHGVVSVFEQEGRSLPGVRHGHEHFGFKDGVSQPGVMGFDPPDPTTPSQVAGKPGTLLIEPGEVPSWDTRGTTTRAAQCPRGCSTGALWLCEGSAKTFRVGGLRPSSSRGP